MDKKSLKSIIIGYKMSGLSYADIATELEKEYGIKMSRQAINGLYKRATSDKEQEKNINIVIKTTDICHYSTLGYTSKEIRDILQEDDLELSLGRITEIIENNTDLVEEIEESIVKDVENQIRNKESIDKIISKLKYKQVSIKHKKWETVLNKASKLYIKDKITEALADIIEITNDRDLVRDMIKTYNVETTFRDIGQKLRKE